MKDDIKEGFTHGGVFHADDVFATALLQIWNPGIHISRGLTVPEDFDGIVYDIGGGKYDHHQKNARVRENGVPYAAFGLLWEELGRDLLSGEDAEKFDEDFVQPIDLADNTGQENMVSLIISDRLPTWREELVQMEDAFWKAVGLARDILEQRFQQIRAERDAYEAVYQRAMQCDGTVLYLEQAMPWKEALLKCGREILYVIYPSRRGGFNIQAVPDREDKNRLRHPFPREWCGADPQELQGMTGIKELVFCHISGFLSVAETLEGAYSVARLAMQAGDPGSGTDMGDGSWNSK